MAERKNKPRPPLYKKGEEVKPQRRPQNLFKGMPEVQKQKTSSKEVTKQESKIRRTQNRSGDPVQKNLAKESKNLRAKDLWFQERDKVAKIHRSDLPQKISQPMLSKHAKNMNRIARVMSEESRKTVITAHKYLSRKLGGIGKDIVSKTRSPVSPAAISFELGMAHLQGTGAKSQKKIKKLRKQAVGT